METKRNILLVEDNESLGYLLSEYLKMKGFSITWSKNGIIALQDLENEQFDLAVLDIMMPEMDGFTLAEKIKQQFPAMPFIFLSARSLKIDVLKGFSLGAVDYLKKPIDEEELVVRITTLLNNLSPVSEEKAAKKQNIALGKYIYKPQNLQLIYEQQFINLTSRENDVLQYLSSRPNELCSHRDILNNLWGKNDYFTRKSLNVFVSHLRKYLDKDTSIKIENIHNQGFVFKIEE
ncbi:MAG: response regulator transcription factor [Gillisia sp.]